MSNEREQLAVTAAVLDRLDGTLNDLFASVAELKTALGLPPEVAAVTAPEPPPRPQGALETAQALQRALEAMQKDLKAATERLSTAEQKEQRRWRVVVGLAVSFAFDIALTVVVTIATAQAHTASERANATVAELHQTQVSACRGGNQTRAQEVALWEHIYALSTPPGAHLTPKQRRTDNALIAYVKHVFAAKDCEALYRIKGTG